MAFQTLVQLLSEATQRYGDRPLFGTRRGGGWSWTSYRQLSRQVDRCRAGLIARGVSGGDKVAIISNNRIEWAVLAHACYSLGAALVPMYQAQNPDDWRYIIEDCSAKLLVCANPAIFKRTESLMDIDSLTQRIGIGLPRADEHSYEQLLADGDAEPVAKTEAAPEDLACLIYTSGTTGKPKGVMLSHRNIASNVNAMRAAFTISSEDRSLSFLPWAHSFGQTCELHTMMSFGASMALCDDNSKIVQVPQRGPTNAAYQRAAHLQSYLCGSRQTDGQPPESDSGTVRARHGVSPQATHDIPQLRRETAIRSSRPIGVLARP